MNRKAQLFIFGAFLLLPLTYASEWQPFGDNNFDSFAYDDVAEPRFLTNLSSTGSFVTFNQTLLLFSGGILLWGIAGAMLLYYLISVPVHGGGTGYDYDYGGSFGYGGSEQQGGYSKRSNGRSFNPYGIDWEKFSILDWISVAEDTWRNFEPSNLDCQKRLICELHQNTLRFGYVAKRLVDLFSYLEYAELLRLPEEAKTIIDDYMDAADRGRSLKKDCGEIYSNCFFSVKKIFDKVTDNAIA